MDACDGSPECACPDCAQANEEAARIEAYVGGEEAPMDLGEDGQDGDADNYPGDEPWADELGEWEDNPALTPTQNALERWNRQQGGLEDVDGHVRPDLRPGHQGQLRFQPHTRTGGSVNKKWRSK